MVVDAKRILWLLSMPIFLVSVLAYPPACNIYYGRPNYIHCRALLHGGLGGVERGIADLDNKHHFFGIGGIERPPEISPTQVSRTFLSPRSTEREALT